MKNTHQSRSRQGFTLLEVAIATVIIALGITALMSTLRAGTTVSTAGNNLTTAMFLAQNVHEWTARLQFRDASTPPTSPGSNPTDDPQCIEDLDGAVYTIPRDGTGEEIPDLPNWAQTVSLEWRNPTELTAKVDPGMSDVIHVTVDIRHRGITVFTLRYFVFNMNPDTDVAGGG